MRERELRKRLLTDPVPGEIEAGRRVWPVVRAAWEGRERVSWVERRARPILALAAAAVLVGAAVSPPGRVAAGWVREQVASEEEGRELLRLPASGRLLVESGRGPWVVRADGSRRLLGVFDEATWSPRGLFVAVTDGRELHAVEPDGKVVRWTLPRPERISDPRWAPSGFRVAYRSGKTLRVVVGDGTGDRFLAGNVGPAPPAWRPGPEHVLAYADEDGGISIVNVDSGEGLRRFHVGQAVHELLWSADGRRLAALIDEERIALFRPDGRLVRTIEARRGRAILAMAFAPSGRDLAVADYSPASGGSILVIRPRTGATRMLLQVPGPLDQLAWAPNGRWILATWPAADQWLFVRTERPSRVLAVSRVTQEFDPGSTGQDAFPRIAGWCCP